MTNQPKTESLAMIAKHLIDKYNVPVPRYTSYPTVPCWDTSGFTVEGWRDSVMKCFDESNGSKGIALYIHLPFCESLCTYCACNTRITKNHSVEERYIDSLLREWQTYLDLFGEAPAIRELHLGGGTPTFFRPENLRRLMNGILEDSELHKSYEFSFEGHPNNTTREHLTALYNKGFRRVSYGVQDLDPKVQKAINRVQPFENVESVTRWSREVGYDSVSFDLVYGLPYQTVDSVCNTITKVISLRPDRISFYSYAHVPWLKPGQRGYEDADLPADEAKRDLYDTGRQMLLDAGYIDIGMDHFALPGDSLSAARRDGKLSRNFMGYTTSQADLLIGLGASAISDAKYAYAQNLKKVEEYESQVRESGLATFKGHRQTAQDMVARAAILSLACTGRLDEGIFNQISDPEIQVALSVMQEEGLLRLGNDGVTVLVNGWPFIRNICSVFDMRLRASRTNTSDTMFSKSI